jgi:hypothetical protein
MPSHAAASTVAGALMWETDAARLIWCGWKNAAILSLGEMVARLRSRSHADLHFSMRRLMFWMALGLTLIHLVDGERVIVNNEIPRTYSSKEAFLSLRLGMKFEEVTQVLGPATNRSRLSRGWLCVWKRKDCRILLRFARSPLREDAADGFLAEGYFVGAAGQVLELNGP